MLQPATIAGVEKTSWRAALLHLVRALNGGKKRMRKYFCIKKHKFLMKFHDNGDSTAIRNAKQKALTHQTKQPWKIHLCNGFSNDVRCIICRWVLGSNPWCSLQFSWSVLQFNSIPLNAFHCIAFCAIRWSSYRVTAKCKLDKTLKCF